MNADQAHPISPEARATDQGVRWLRRQIGYWSQRANRASVGAPYRSIEAYYQTLMIEALEHRITAFRPDYFTRLPYVP